MFKKLHLIILIFILFTSKSFANFDVKAKTAIIQDYHSGEILFEKEADLSNLSCIHDKDYDFHYCF